MLEEEINHLIKLSQRIEKELQKAREYQSKLLEKCVLKDGFSKVETVLGFDVAYKDDKGYAAGVMVDLKTGEILKKETLIQKVKIGYISSFLFLREVPILLKLLSKFEDKPDVVIIDGHGIAHPNFSGSATIFGILADIPTIGVAKKSLAFQLQTSNNSEIDIIYVKKTKVGFFLRDKQLYVSPGHKVSFSSALKTVNKLLSPTYRLPSVLHFAHIIATEYKNTS
ncbi:MAG: endonuclease V [Candidatus Heimdallarchaeaceae archaeon]